MAPDDLVERGDKLEESLCIYYPKQQHVDCRHLTAPLSWLGLYVDLHRVRIFHQRLPDGYIGLVGRGSTPRF